MVEEYIWKNSEVDLLYTLTTSGTFHCWSTVGTLKTMQYENTWYNIVNHSLTICWRFHPSSGWLLRSMILRNQSLVTKITIHPEPSIQGPALIQDLEISVPHSHSLVTNLSWHLVPRNEDLPWSTTRSTRLRTSPWQPRLPFPYLIPGNQPLVPSGPWSPPLHSLVNKSIPWPITWLIISPI